MGSSTPARTFAPSTPFGASPQAPIATETQPLATVTGASTPALSGYNMQAATPPPPAPAPQMDGSMDNLQQWRANRNGSGRMPFLG